MKILCYSPNSYIFRPLLNFTDREIDGRRLEFYFAVVFTSKSDEDSRWNKRFVEEKLSHQPTDRVLINYSLNEAVERLVPDVLITPHPEQPLKLPKSVPRPYTVYLSHGFWIINSSQYMKEIKNHPYLRGFDLLLLEHYQHQAAERLFKKKHLIMNGSPQLDHLRGLDLTARKEWFCRLIDRRGNLSPTPVSNHLDPSKPWIVFFQNHRGNNDYDRLDRRPDLIVGEYLEILQVVVEFAEKNGYHLICKYKGANSYLRRWLKKDPREKKIRALHRRDSVTLIDNSVYVSAYDLFAADLFVIETGGTTLLETLYQTPRVIRCQLYNDSNIFGMDAYPKLLQARTTTELDQRLREAVDGSVFDDDYQSQRTAFLHDYYRDPEVDTTDQICRELVRRV